MSRAVKREIFEVKSATANEFIKNLRVARMMEPNLTAMLVRKIETGVGGYKSAMSIVKSFQSRRSQQIVTDHLKGLEAAGIITIENGYVSMLD